MKKPTKVAAIGTPAYFMALGYEIMDAIRGNEDWVDVFQFTLPMLAIIAAAAWSKIDKNKNNIPDILEDEKADVE